METSYIPSGLVMCLLNVNVKDVHDFQYHKAVVPFLRLLYHCVTVAFKLLYGLVERINVSVMQTQLHKRSHINALILIPFINIMQPQR